jgi:2,5-furandicarboxylate decarboxylase 1
MTERGLREFLGRLEREHPEQIVHVREAVDPARFDVTAVLRHLELRRKFPLVVFDRPLDLHGRPSAFPIATNIYATRARCALALGLRAQDDALALSLEYARREVLRLRPEPVARADAPVTEVTRREDADLRAFPLVRQHEMDAAPYIDMTCVVRDPETGAYNAAFLRNMYKGPRKLGLHMSPRQSWQVARAYEARGEAMPIAIVVSHHPAFHIGALNVAPFGTDDYGVIGGMIGAPLRVTPSATLGDDFLIPADADVVIEGIVPPGVREVEGPFGEFPGTYGPQRVRWVIEVRAIQHRGNAIWQNVFSGHPDTWVLGSFPKEGSLFNRIKGVVPGVRAVHLPTSGVGRFHCYISIDKRVDGESKQAALIALGECDFVKHVFVVDADIDVYREDEVLWAVATRVQADEDVDVIKNVKGNALDPSQRDDIMGAKMIVDATRPLSRPFEARIAVPEEAMRRIDIDRLIGRDQLERSV